MNTKTRKILCEQCGEKTIVRDGKRICIECHYEVDEPMTKEAQHAAGEWDIGVSETMVYQNGALIADCGAERLFKPEVLKANARLIAAAPELLEACKLAKEFFELGDDDSMNGKQNKKIVELKLIEAIAKAKGE